MEDKNYIYEINNEPNQINSQNDTYTFESKGELITIDTSIINLILNDINNNFFLEDFSLFEENELLDFFYDREKLSLEFIDANFKEKENQKQFLHNYVSEIIEEKYKYNKSIDNLRIQIEKKFDEIIEDIQNCKDINHYDLSEKYIKKLGTKNIPKFLEKNIQEVFEILKLVNEVNEKDEVNSKDIKNEKPKIEIDYDYFIVCYFRFLNKERIPFDMEKKETIFKLLLYSNLKDIYKNPKIKKIFVDNYLNISECLNYFEGISEFEKVINEKENELNLIDIKSENIFNNYKISDNHLHTIASFFYLIINIMKDTEINNINNGLQKQKDNNLNKPFMIKILKNILKCFAKYCSNFGYTTETYKSLLNYFNNYLNEKEISVKANDYYGPEDIEKKIRNTQNYKYISEYESLIGKIKIGELFSTLLNGLKDFFKLIPLKKDRNSQSITILISGFLSQMDDFDSWKLFYNFDKDNSNYYLFKWPSSNSISLAIRVYIDILNSAASFISCYKKAEYAGRVLALFLLSNEDFYDCQINLVGFSLGCQVIKNCLDELDEFKNNKFMINNVLLMGGATVIEESEKNKWRDIFKENVAGRIINCYSKCDNVLSILFKSCIFNTPIGIQTLDIKSEDEEYPIVEDYDFSDIELGHLDYRNKFDIILKRINLFDWN